MARRPSRMLQWSRGRERAVGLSDRRLARSRFDHTSKLKLTTLIVAMAAGTLSIPGHAADDEHDGLRSNDELGHTAPGLNVAIGGLGLDRQNGSWGQEGQTLGGRQLTLEVGGPIEAAYLYWSGRDDASATTIILDQTLFTGTLAGHEGASSWTFRADVTDYVRSVVDPSGHIGVDVDVPGAHRLDGVALVAMWTDLSDPASYRVSIQEGADFAYGPLLPSAAGSTRAVTFEHGAADVDRAATLTIVAGGGTAAGSDTIVVDGRDQFVDALTGAAGPRWDVLARPITLGASVDRTTVELRSPRFGRRAPDSLNWALAVLRAPCVGTLGDRVWNDLDGNGLQAGDEPGIAGVRVVLHAVEDDGALTPMAETVTDADGHYEFATLCGRAYALEIDATTVPADFVPVTAHVGGARDSDFENGFATVGLGNDAEQYGGADAGFAPGNACCLPDGSCALVSVDGCDQMGGNPFAGQHSCEAVVCTTVPYGACCYDDGTCGTSTPAECIADGGLYRGDGATCASVTCEDGGSGGGGGGTETGACCLTDGICAPATAATCGIAGGLYFGDGTACSDVSCQPIGACCLTDGSCVTGFPSECNSLGGSFVGNGTTCGNVVCPTTGACCLTDGSCTATDATTCQLAGGAFNGTGSDCADATCVASGACCLPGGGCVVASTAICDTAGGSYDGDGSDCGPGACIVVDGACCLPDGSCITTDDAGCQLAGGAFGGAGVDCADAGCVATGACCLTGGACTVNSLDDCNAAGGAYNGDGTDCVVDACPVAVACCLPDGTCDLMEESECQVSGGTNQPEGEDCDSVLCIASGACCFDDGTCASLSANDCSTAGGAYQSDGMDCATANCVPSGACCFDDGTCAFIPDVDCATAGGAFQGTGDCASASCPQTGVDLPKRATASSKGSLVIFSKVEVRWSGQAPYDSYEDTFLSLTNDAAEDVWVQMHFINGDEPLDAVYDENGVLIERAHPGWNSVDVLIELTANQPTYWSARTGLPAAGGVSPFTVLDPGTPPGRPADDGTDDRVLRGYVVAWAVDADNEEIRWNHLAGNATIVNYALGTAWEYASMNHAVVSGAAQGDAPDGTPGELRLDGVEYEWGYDLLLLNFQAVGSGAFGAPPAPISVFSDTEVTFVPISVDLRQTNDGPVTTKASIDVWNQNEVKFSGAHRCVTCWSANLLSRFDAPNHFLVQNLQTQHGKARIDGHAAPLQCDVLDDPDTPEDESVTSIAAAMTGVAVRRLAFDGSPSEGEPFTGVYDRAGSTLYGMGLEAGTIRYDVLGAPPEGEALALPPMQPTRDELTRFIDDVLRTLEHD